MSTDISTTAIQSFLGSLPQEFLKVASPTNLPTTIPLAWPSDLHQLNFLTVLHLSYTVLSLPSHRTLLAEIRERASDVALRGCLGLYLASDQGWDAGNYLSARAWRDGVLDEARVAEYFDIKIHRERQHETMPITLGERYPLAVSMVADLCALFKTIGESISGSCIGEEVVALLTNSKEHTKTEADPTFAFAKDFCSRVTQLMPLFADQYPDPPGKVLPAAPLRLLQDLSHVFGSSHATFSLPEAALLANVSPLPLPLAVVLHLGILQPENIPGGAELKHASGDWWTGSKPDLFTPAPADGGKAPLTIVKVPQETLGELIKGSIQACSDIAGHARVGDIAWQKELTFLDVSRVCAQLDEVLDANDKGLRIVLK